MMIRRTLNQIFSFTVDTPMEEVRGIFDLNSKACNIFLLQKSIELERYDILKECVKILDSIDSLCLQMCVQYNRLTMLKRLLGFKIQECPYSVSYYLVSLYNSHPSFQCIKDIQECCRRIFSNNIYSSHSNFIKTQAKLRESHIKHITRELYYNIIQNVVCNPNHKIGRKLILKQYNDYLNKNINLY